MMSNAIDPILMIESIEFTFKYNLFGLQVMGLHQ